MAGLPQMKLGWIAVGGNEPTVREAAERLEIILDTYLSVNTPVQIALPVLMRMGKKIRAEILDRVRVNFEFLQNRFASGSSCSLLNMRKVAGMELFACPHKIRRRMVYGTY